VTQDLLLALELGVEAAMAAGLRYAVVGGLAVGAWGVPRATRDVDLYVELPAGARPRLQAELERRGFHVPAMDAELERFGVFRSRSRDGVSLDVFDAVGPLGEAVLAHCREIDLEGLRLAVVAPEELVVLKAFSDRGRDSEDLAGLLQVHGEALDLSYVEEWTRRLDESIGGNEVSERLRAALPA